MRRAAARAASRAAAALGSLATVAGCLLSATAGVVPAVAAAAPPARLLAVNRAFDPAPPADQPPVVVPVPQRADYPSGTLPLTGLALHVEDDAPAVQQAGRWLQQAIEDRFHDRLDEGRQAGPRQPGANPAVVIGTLADGRLASQARSRGFLATGPWAQPEGYALHVGPDGAFVVGADARGAFYGVQTLIQLLVATPRGPGLRYADIADWPAFPVRMAMIYLDAHSAGINDRLVPILAHYKFNQVLVMADYVRWDSAPNIWNPAGAAKDEARRVAGLIRASGMEPVPLIELLGHAQWLFYGDQNLDLLQDPESPEPYAYDPLNPRTYDVVLPILDEAIEVFRPRYVHIGHDEVRNVVRFPASEAGKRIGFNRIFYDDVLRLYNHLKSRGVGTMMWQDVAFTEATKEIVADLPKDILFTDWHYSPGADFPSVREIRAAGFDVIGASWYRPGNAEEFARSALRDGALGMLQTRWTGYFGNSTLARGQAEQAVAYVRAAASFWRPAAPIPDERAAQRFADAWRPAAWRAVPGHLVDLRPFATRTLVDSDGSGWLGKGPGYDLAPLVEQSREGIVKLGPYTFHVSAAVMTRMNRGVARDLPDQVTIPLHAPAAAVAVLHTTGWPAPAVGQPAGSYTLTYEDGTTLEQPLEYGRNIAAWTDTLLTSLERYPAWRGVTSEGLAVGADVLEISNPHPEKRIASLTVTSDVRWTNPVVLGLTLLDALPPRDSSSPEAIRP